MPVWFKKNINSGFLFAVLKETKLRLGEGKVSYFCSGGAVVRNVLLLLFEYSHLPLLYNGRRRSKIVSDLDCGSLLCQLFDAIFGCCFLWSSDCRWF